MVVSVGVSVDGGDDVDDVVVNEDEDGVDGDDDDDGARGEDEDVGAFRRLTMRTRFVGASAMVSF